MSLILTIRLTEQKQTMCMSYGQLRVRWPLGLRVCLWRQVHTCTVESLIWKNVITHNQMTTVYPKRSYEPLSLTCCVISTATCVADTSRVSTQVELARALSEIFWKLSLSRRSFTCRTSVNQTKQTPLSVSREPMHIEEVSGAPKPASVDCNVSFHTKT